MIQEFVASSPSPLLVFLARYWMIQEFVASSPSPFFWFSEQVWSLALHLQEAMI